MANKYLVVADAGRFAGYVCAQRTIFVEADDDYAAFTVAGARLYQEMLTAGRSADKALSELSTLNWRCVLAR